MRDDPYPARDYAHYYERIISRSSTDERAVALSSDSVEFSLFPSQQPLARVLLIFMTLYFACAIFLIFTVSSYAAPLGNGTISSPLAAECVETVTIAAR